ncbi:MAG: 2-hydroxyacid dehydrogenase [Prevotella sp.]|nr:2-hydroxyacid dehydrogenase [Staphylococcus sp.]MCM1349850.1 2-hydroxyacid dehydrogenase [Prevotella sp.]
MKILFYGAKNYDRESFDQQLRHFPHIELNYIDAELDAYTVYLANHFDGICVFVNANVTKEIIEILDKLHVKLILLRCAGFNNVDLNACVKRQITVMRVPNYSPEAVAEMAMTLALSVNRKLHKAYIKVRENNFALSGLTGLTLFQKTAGIIGTGKIGQAMAKICHGFGMRVIAYDKYPASQLPFIEYVSLNEVLRHADLISLHCPLNAETYHMINEKTISRMKDGVILVNTSRGGLIKTEDLIKGIRDHKFFGVALDVYEEEGDYVFENLEDDILEHSTTARLLSFPNVIVTSHQGFLTQEALEAISRTTLENALSFENHQLIDENVVKMP